jgi:hypothetical protein
MSRMPALYESIRIRVIRCAECVHARVRTLLRAASEFTKVLAVQAAPVVAGVAAGVAAVLAEPRTRSVTIAAVITVALGAEAALGLLVAALWVSAKIVVLTFLLDHSLRRLPWHRVAALRRGTRVAAAGMLFWVAALSFGLGHAVCPRPALAGAASPAAYVTTASGPAAGTVSTPAVNRNAQADRRSRRRPAAAAGLA